MEAELTPRDWFAGDAFSAANIQMSLRWKPRRRVADLGGRFPRLTGWLGRIHARPAYQRALDVGGPYELLT